MSFDDSRYNEVYTPDQLNNLQVAYDTCVENLKIEATDEDEKLALAKRIMSEAKSIGCEPDELVKIITNIYKTGK